jgi:putative MFS transporter
MLCPYAVVALFTSYGIAGVVGSLSIMLVGVAAIVAIFGIETRRKPLEAINPEEVPVAAAAALRSP